METALVLHAPSALAPAGASRLLALGHGEANLLGTEWRSALMAEGLAPATINRRLAALRSLVALAWPKLLTTIAALAPCSYARIIKEVRAAIERENAEALVTAGLQVGELRLNDAFVDSWDVVEKANDYTLPQPFGALQISPNGFEGFAGPIRNF